MGASRTTYWPALLAAILYFVLLFWTFPFLRSPSVAMPLEGGHLSAQTGIDIADEKLVAFVIARNADHFLTSPRELFETGHCYPIPRPATLGEHMFGEGLLGAPAYALTGDPILTFNAAVALTYWIGAMAAYAAVFHWTGSASAAFVSGLLYGFHPLRTEDPIHPFIIANHWTIVALLSADRLFQRRRWIDAAALGVSLSLQLLESFYTVLGMALIGGAYGLHLLIAHRRALRGVGGKLLASLALAGTVTWAVLSPYLEARETWGMLRNRTNLSFPGEFAPGSRAYPGTVILLLAGVALVARLRRRGHAPAAGSDPRIAIAAGGGLAFWACVYFVPLPFGWSIPSLWILASGTVPGLDSVRAGLSLRLGVYLAAALLAGFGVAALCDRRSRFARAAILASIIGLWGVETFVPDAAVRTFGHRVDLVSWSARPPDETIRLYQRIDEGAVLDLPLTSTSIAGFLAQASDYLFLHAYHRQPAAACNDSFVPELPLQVVATAGLLPKRYWKLDTFWALGFDYLVVHEDRIPADQRARFFADLQSLEHRRERHAYLEPIARDAARRLYRIDASLAVESNVESLTLDSDGVVQSVRRPQAVLRAFVRNPSPAVFAAAVLEPTWLVVRWFTPEGVSAGEERVRVLFPVGLPAKDQQRVTIPVSVPAAGDEFTATVSFASRPDDARMRLRVQVEHAS